MRAAIVDLERASAVTPARDGVAIAALCAGAIVFAIVVGVGAHPNASVGSDAAGRLAIDGSNVQRGAVMRPLHMTAAYADVELAAMPERLTNEASPSTLRDVVTVRGVPAVASVDAPAVISWTESGIVYWLMSRSRSVSELVRIADGLVP